MVKRILIYPIVSMSVFAILFFTDYSPLETGNTMPEITVEEYDPIVVFELFTSQGCSSCPPADALLNKVKSRDGVFALSYHVDYWNYIGWRDPFSKSSYSNKQNEYNVKFRSRSNYTPQLVVNGKEHFVGSNAALIHKSVATYGKRKPANGVEIKSVEKNAGKINFDYKVLGNTQGKQVRAVLVIEQRTTLVKRGENRNRTLVNSNIVVAEKNSPAVTAQQSDFITIPELVNVDDALELVLLVENDAHDITGATKAFVK